MTTRIIFNRLVLTGFLTSILFLGREALAKQPPAPVLDYHLSWQGGSTKLNVRLNYTPATSDSTVFTFGTPEFGGQVDIFDVLKQIAGSPDDSISIQPEKRKIIVHHHGSSLRQLTYQVDGKLKGDKNRAIYDELFRPVINDGTLYVVSLVFMVTPENHPAKKIGIQWDNVLQGMTYFLSYAPTADPLTKQMIPVSQSQAILIAVGNDLITKQYQVGKVPYYLVASKKDTVNTVSTVFAPFFERYFPAIRNYWNDYSSPYYYLAPFPLLSTRNDAMSGGFAWGPGFIFKYGGKLDDSEEKTIAHEHAHLWIGQSITIGENSFSNQWFGEGFNDYVCIVNLVRSGMLTKSAFLDYVNKENFNSHYTSSVRDSSNASIAKSYWSNPSFQKLPYRRGFIYAFYVDNQIRLATNGKHSLRDVLLVLLDRARKRKTTNSEATLTVKDFIDAVAIYLPREQVEREVQVNMLSGKPLDFRTISLVNGFTVDYEGEVPVLRLDPSFDLVKFYEK